MKQERRYCQMGRVALETRSDDGNRITGLAAVYYDGTARTEYELFEGTVERIMPGTFQSALDGKDDVVALFNHDPNQLLGRLSAGTLALEDRDEGLAYSITPPDTNASRDVVANLKMRNVQGSSFAFAVTDEDVVKKDGIWVREVRGVELYDVGPVTYPAYKATTAEAASSDLRRRIDLLEREMRLAWIEKHERESPAQSR